MKISSSRDFVNFKSFYKLKQKRGWRTELQTSQVLRSGWNYIPNIIMFLLFSINLLKSWIKFFDVIPVNRPVQFVLERLRGNRNWSPKQEIPRMNIRNSHVVFEPFFHDLDLTHLWRRRKALLLWSENWEENWIENSTHKFWNPWKRWRSFADLNIAVIFHRKCIWLHMISDFGFLLLEKIFPVNILITSCICATHLNLF